jgi:hypothetical protein
MKHPLQYEEQEKRALYMPVVNTSKLIVSKVILNEFGYVIYFVSCSLLLARGACATAAR